MKKLFILFFIFSTSLILAQAPEWQWANSAGGMVHDYGYAVSTDSNGNIYVTGYILETAYFDSISITSVGDDDIFVAKMDPAGNWLWAKRAGATDEPYGDRGYGIAVDEDGNCFITGKFYDTADFGGTTLESEGSSDIFVAKLDTNGNWLWARRAGGTWNAEGLSITTDSDVNCLITGCFYSEASFGNITIYGYGSTDPFVAKLDANGNWLWVTCGGSELHDEANDIETDSNGNSYICGYFEDTATFGSTQLTSSGDDDIFIAKLDVDGNWLWAKRAGGTANDKGYGVGTDSNGNCFATGFFYTSADFGSFPLISSGQGDIFIAKLDTDGNWLWAKQAGGGSENDTGYDITAGNDGSCYAVGSFKYSATFGPDSFISNNHTDDVFVTSLDSNGEWLWTSIAGGSNSFGDCGYGIAIDESGNHYVTGVFCDGADFGEITLTSEGINDIFVSNLYTPTGVTTEVIQPYMYLSNYPNPFNPSTTISFTISNELHEQSELMIYNVKGQKIKVIPITLSGDEGSVIWNGTDQNNQQVSSGIYFYKLKAGNYEETKKMILLK